MIARVTAGILLLSLLTGCASSALFAQRRWNGASAVADAERDIASSKIRFAYVGGFVPVAPGLPTSDTVDRVLLQHARLPVGPQGCRQDEHADERRDYALRYNERMWQHVSGKPPKSSNQAMQRTAPRSDV